jgi:hypothetical protein
MPPDGVDVLVCGKVKENVVHKYGAHWYTVLCRVKKNWVRDGFDGDHWYGFEPEFWTLLPDPPK